jgi:hypothetical protein
MSLVVLDPSAAPGPVVISLSPRLFELVGMEQDELWRITKRSLSIASIMKQSKQTVGTPLPPRAAIPPTDTAESALSSGVWSQCPRSIRPVVIGPQPRNLPGVEAIIVEADLIDRPVPKAILHIGVRPD